MIPTIASIEMRGANKRLICGNSGRLNRTSPYVPIFNRTPARRTDPAVGASTCASGSHVWNGKRGTLMANARKNARKSHNSMLGDSTSRPDASADWICG